MRLARSIPFFNALVKAPNKNRVAILKKFPIYVVDDLVEILYNIVTGRVKIGNHASKLQKYKSQLLKLKNAKTKKARRNIIYKQKGGILPFLLPLLGTIATSALGGVISGAIKNRMSK